MPQRASEPVADETRDHHRDRVHDDAECRHGGARVRRTGEEDRVQFIAADSTKIEQNVRNAGSASAPRGSAKGPCRLGGGSRQQPRNDDDRDADHAGGDERELDAGADPGGRGARRDGRARRAARSSRRRGGPRAAGARASRSSVDAVRIRGTSTMPIPAPSTQAAGISDASDGANAASVRPPAQISSPRPFGRAAAEARREPAGDRQHERRGERDAEDDDAELAAVEPEPVLQCRQPRGPRAVDRSERDERDGEGHVGGAEPLGR